MRVAFFRSDPEKEYDEELLLPAVWRGVDDVAPDDKDVGKILKILKLKPLTQRISFLTWLVLNCLKKKLSNLFHIDGNFSKILQLNKTFSFLTFRKKYPEISKKSLNLFICACSDGFGDAWVRLSWV